MPITLLHEKDHVCDGSSAEVMESGIGLRFCRSGQIFLYIQGVPSGDITCLEIGSPSVSIHTF